MFSVGGQRAGIDHLPGCFLSSLLQAKQVPCNGSPCRHTLCNRVSNAHEMLRDFSRGCKIGDKPI